MHDNIYELPRLCAEEYAVAPELKKPTPEPSAPDSEETVPKEAAVKKTPSSDAPSSSSSSKHSGPPKVAPQQASYESRQRLLEVCNLPSLIPSKNSLQDAPSWDDPLFVLENSVLYQVEISESECASGKAHKPSPGVLTRTICRLGRVAPLGNSLVGSCSRHGRDCNKVIPTNGRWSDVYRALLEWLAEGSTLPKGKQYEPDHRAKEVHLRFTVE